MTNNRSTREEKREASRRTAQSIRDKAAVAGVKANALVKSNRSHPSHATNHAVRQAALPQIISIKEIWQLHLLNQLMDPTNPMIPPSPHFSSFQKDDVAASILGIQLPSGSFSPNRVVFVSENQIQQFAEPQRLQDRQLNYTRSTGRSYGQITLTGDVGCFVWCDPFDVQNPIRYNLGPVDLPFWKGSFYGGTGSYAGLPLDSLVSGSFTWAPGSDPRVIPTEYMNVDGVSVTTPGASAADSYKKVFTYPYDPTYISTAQLEYAARVHGSNYISWITSVRMVVSVSNPTAFSATSMRARTQGDTVHRYAERIEDPSNGSYGLTTPFVRSNFAETVWHGSSWQIPQKDVIVTQSSGFWIDAPSFEVANAQWKPVGASNWNSLQRSLEAMVPVVEITQNTDSPTRAVNVSVEAIYEYCMVPVTNTTPVSGNDNLTFPARLPLWYAPNSYLASISPVDCSIQGSFVPALNPLATQAMGRTISAVRSDVSSKPAIQSLAQESHKKPQDVLHRVKSVADDVMGALSSVAGVVSNGIAPALKFGNIVKNIFGKAPLLRAIAPAVTKALPMIEMAAAAA